MQNHQTRRTSIRLFALVTVLICQISSVAQEYEYVTASTENNTEILLWEWNSSDIVVTDAPPGAVVHHMDVYYEVKHPCVRDIEIDLTNQMANISHDLYDPSVDFSCRYNQAVWETDITTFAGYPVNRTWTLYTIDWVWGKEGYIDKWRMKIYYTIPSPPAHDEADAAVIVQENEPYHGTSLGATGDLESEIDWLDTHDVWHLYSPSATGLAHFSLEGSDFDTSLAVYDHGGETLQATNDDVEIPCEEMQLWSSLALPVREGEQYQVRVAGLAEAMGDYTLGITLAPTELPETPQRPLPLSNSEVSANQVTLAWNDWQRPLQSAGEPPSTQEEPTAPNPLKAIYGRDDRVDEYSITDPEILAVGAATAMLLPRASLQERPDGTFKLPEETLIQWHRQRAQEYYLPSLCSSVRFKEQPIPAECTGFLVAPDIILSAGHCTACISDSNDTAVVFDFVMLDAKTPVSTVDRGDVYYCKEVIAQSSGKPDWAIIRLDRPVHNREPLPIRHSGKIADDQPVLAIGHPWGLPRKYDLGGSVRDNNDIREFQASVDAFMGSSGSPVLNLDTLEVEGILVADNQGFTIDYQHGVICMRSIRCSDEEGCPSWASVTRTTSFASLIPSYDVYLGTDPKQLKLIASYLVSPAWEPSGIKAGSTYYWQVRARNHAGEVAGPLWSFRTRP